MHANIRTIVGRILGTILPIAIMWAMGALVILGFYPGAERASHFWWIRGLGNYIVAVFIVLVIAWGVQTVRRRHFEMACAVFATVLAPFLVFTFLDVPQPITWDREIRNTEYTPKSPCFDCGGHFIEGGESGWPLAYVRWERYAPGGIGGGARRLNDPLVTGWTTDFILAFGTAWLALWGMMSGAGKLIGRNKVTPNTNLKSSHSAEAPRDGQI